MLRLPPQSNESEQAVLGSMLIDQKSVEKALNLLTEEHFYFMKNREIFKCIKILKDTEINVDIITLCELLRTKKLYDRFGGAVYVKSLIDRVTTTANLEDYIKMVDDKFIQRKIIELSSGILEQSYNGENPDLLFGKIEETIRKLKNSSQDTETKSMKELCETLTEDYEARQMQFRKGSPYPSGFVDWDKKTGGYVPGKLYVVGGYTSHGKTVFGTQSAAYLAVKGIQVLYITSEMNAKSIRDRIISLTLEIYHQKCKFGNLTPEDWKYLSGNIEKVRSMTLSVNYCPGLKYSRIENIIKYGKVKPQVVFIDYIQLIRTAGKDTRTRELDELMQSLKDLAGKLDINITVMSQLHRSGKDAKYKEPNLDDLRDAGGIEQSADVVTFIHRIKEKSEGKMIETKALIKKNRDGETGDIDLIFNSDIVKFLPVTKIAEDSKVKNWAGSYD